MLEGLGLEIVIDLTTGLKGPRQVLDGPEIEGLFLLIVANGLTLFWGQGLALGQVELDQGTLGHAQPEAVVQIDRVTTLVLLLYFNPAYAHGAPPGQVASIG